MFADAKRTWPYGRHTGQVIFLPSRVRTGSIGFKGTSPPLDHTRKRPYCFSWFWFLCSARWRRSSSSVWERCGPAGRSSVPSARTSLLHAIRSEPECVGLPVTVTCSPDLIESAVQPRFERFSLPANSMVHLATLPDGSVTSRYMSACGFTNLNCVTTPDTVTSRDSSYTPAKE